MSDTEEMTAEERIEEAATEAASTHRSWEDRCYAILRALGLDFGEPSPDIPEVGSYSARKIQMLENDKIELYDKVFKLRMKLKEAGINPDAE
jgi:hypothetical protein